MSRRPMNRLLLPGLCLALALLGGCGQKGPLTLPKPEPAAPAAPSQR